MLGDCCATALFLFPFETDVTVVAHVSLEAILVCGARAAFVLDLIKAVTLPDLWIGCLWMDAVGR